MKKSLSIAGKLSRNTMSEIFGRVAFIPLASVTLLLTACGGGGSDSGSSQSGGTNPPILQVGMQRQYVGTTTQSVVYTNPTGTQQNHTLGYSFTRALNVLQAQENAPAPFDIQTINTYTLTQDPGTGMVPVSETVDTYETLNTTGATQTTSTIAETETIVSNDETANNLGGGPYTSTLTNKYTYPTPLTSLSYPLQTASTLSVPEAYSLSAVFNDVNAGGVAPPNGQSVAYTELNTHNNDGSFASQTNRANGVVLSTTVNSNGSASYSGGGPNVYTTTIGVPVLANGAYTIPVNYTSTSPTTNNTNFVAADWYPGSGAVPTPLRSQIETVIGPVTTLPAGCNGAQTQSNMVEIDTTSTALNPTISLVVSKTQAFNSNNVTVCSLVQSTNSSYDIYTGALTSTTTTQTATLLTSIISN